MSIRNAPKPPIYLNNNKATPEMIEIGKVFTKTATAHFKQVAAERGKQNFTFPFIPKKWVMRIADGYERLYDLSFEDEVKQEMKLHPYLTVDFTRHLEDFSDVFDTEGVKSVLTQFHANPNVPTSVMAVLSPYNTGATTRVVVVFGNSSDSYRDFGQDPYQSGDEAGLGIEPIEGEELSQSQPALVSDEEPVEVDEHSQPQPNPISWLN